MSRRSEILKEMGLAPVWRLRSRAAPEDAQVQPDAQTAAGSERAVPASAPEPLALPAGSREERIARMGWDDLKAEVAKCTACGLRAGCTQTVFGVGDEKAEWLLVGEAPGAEEDRLGEPFVGQAGKLLDNMLAAVNLDRHRNVFIANVLKCLRYNALVQLADGSWERIGRLVRRKYDGQVMSVDARGRIVPRRVTGWHETPLGGRRVFRFTYRAAKNAGASRVGIQLTGDHPVLTQRGFVPVEQLVHGDRVATGQGLSALAFDVVCGTLLGDGCLNSSRSSLTLGHSAAQREYAIWKAELLQELNPDVRELSVAAVVGGPKKYGVVQVSTPALRALRILRRDFYAAKKKVPEWMCDRLNERMLAIWFMDDGYMRIRPDRQPLAEIATCGFEDGDLRILERGLSRLGLRTNTRRGRLFFDVTNSRLLSERIAPFVPPSMRYKLHPAVAERVAFDPDRFDFGTQEVFYDDVELEDVTLHKRSDTTFFCIDVEETHNFVTAGGVVHNCRPPGNRNPEPEEMAKCGPFLLRQIALIRPRLILAMGRFAVQSLLQTDASIASLRGRLHRYAGVPLIVTYHPAYLLRSLPEKAKSWADLRFAVKTLAELKKGAPSPQV